MLDQKSKQLSQQEKALQKKEKNFELFKLEWVRKIDAEYQSLCKKQELKMQKEVQSLNKKINQVERNMSNKVKIMQETQKLQVSHGAS
jgi:hypothetical protein